MPKAVKLSDIAEKFSVSNVTVSKALSGQKGVSEDLREKIIEYADEIGYRQPSTHRKELAKYKKHQIGIIIDETYIDKYDSFYWQMYKHISTHAMNANCFCILEVINEEIEAKNEIPEIIKEKKVNGIIVIGKLSEQYLQSIRESVPSLPIVFLDFSSNVNNIDAVVSDGFHGGYQLTKYLLSQGHTKIGYVGTLMATDSIRDRYFGYCKALLEEGIEVRKDWLIEDRLIGSGIIKEELIQFPQEMPTAFFCNCDLVAAKLIQKLNDSGYNVPEDISVVGFDNYIHPGICPVRITSYDVNQPLMAKNAVSLLLNRILGDTDNYGTHIVTGKLIEKESVKTKA